MLHISLIFRDAPESPLDPPGGNKAGRGPESVDGTILKAVLLETAALTVVRMEMA